MTIDTMSGAHVHGHRNTLPEPDMVEVAATWDPKPAAAAQEVANEKRARAAAYLLEIEKVPGLEQTGLRVRDASTSEARKVRVGEDIQMMGRESDDHEIKAVRWGGQAAVEAHPNGTYVTDAGGVVMAPHPNPYPTRANFPAPKRVTVMGIFTYNLKLLLSLYRLYFNMVEA